MYTFYDYAKSEMVELSEIPTTDEEAMRLIPQGEAYQGLYRVHREMGKSVQEAMTLVLQRIADQHMIGN